MRTVPSDRASKGPAPELWARPLSWGLLQETEKESDRERREPGVRNGEGAEIFQGQGR